MTHLTIQYKKLKTISISKQNTNEKHESRTSLLDLDFFTLFLKELISAYVVFKLKVKI